MKVKRIITTIEVEDNNSTTSVELTKLFLDEHYVPLVATNISSNKRNIMFIKKKFSKFNRSSRIIIFNFNSSNNTFNFHKQDY